MRKGSDVEQMALLYTTWPDAGTAERAAATAVGARLTACANILPAGRSIYRWQGQIETARDCGASFVLIKPISARVLLDRIVWIGRAGRLFVETEGYVGPDRRFRNDGVPGGGRGRRHDDLSTRIGAASEPNMSQDEIDTLMKPQKVSL